MYFPQVLIQYGRRLCPLHFTWLRWLWCVSLSGTMTQLDGTLLVNGLLPSAAWCLVCAGFLSLSSYHLYLKKKKNFVCEWHELKRGHSLSLPLRIIIVLLFNTNRQTDSLTLKHIISFWQCYGYWAHYLVSSEPWFVFFCVCVEEDLWLCRLFLLSTSIRVVPELLMPSPRATTTQSTVWWQLLSFFDSLYYSHAFSLHL